MNSNNTGTNLPPKAPKPFFLKWIPHYLDLNDGNHYSKKYFDKNLSELNRDEVESLAKMAHKFVSQNFEEFWLDGYSFVTKSDNVSNQFRLELISSEDISSKKYVMSYNNRVSKLLKIKFKSKIYDHYLKEDLNIIYYHLYKQCINLKSFINEHFEYKDIKISYPFLIEIIDKNIVDDYFEKENEKRNREKRNRDYDKIVIAMKQSLGIGDEFEFAEGDYNFDDEEEDRSISTRNVRDYEADIMSALRNGTGDQFGY